MFRVAVALLALLPALATGCSDRIRIAAVISRTGAAAPSGDGVDRGLELALEDVNAEGGVRGRAIELAVVDDATNPEVGLRALRDLLGREPIAAVIGAVSSPVTLRLADLCESRRIVLLSPTASSAEISDAGAFVFRIFPSDVLEGTAMADFARDQGYRKVALAALREPRSRDLADAFAARFETGGFRRVAARGEWDEGSADSLAAAAALVAASAPDAVYVAAYTDTTAAFARRLREAGSDAVVLATSGVRLEQTPRFGAGSAVVPVTGFDSKSDDPATAVFVTRFRERFRDEPDQFAAHGYDALRVLVDAMRRSGADSGDALRDALLDTHDYNGASGRIAFDAKGDVVRYPRLVVVESGRQVPYETFVAHGGALAANRR